MNESIELHDSELVGVMCNKDEVIVSLSPAYIHRSIGVPGVDPGSGWLGPATLTISSALLSTSLPVLPATISDGFLRIASETYDNAVPAGGTFVGAIELSLALATGESLIIFGQGIRIQLHGEPSFLEDYDGQAPLAGD